MKDILDRLNGPFADITVDTVKVAAHEISELRRTRSEAEAAARVAGYEEGKRDLRRDLNALLRP
jgi:hypothetical protein